MSMVKVCIFIVVVLDFNVMKDSVKTVIIVDGFRTPVEFKYDKQKDVCEVSQIGFVDLAECYANHSVPADIVPTDDTYNGIDEPASILGRSKDVFTDALVRQSIADYKPSEKKVE